MRLLASLVYCLLALAGCHERNGTTSITRATSEGRDVLFSKTLATASELSMHCLASSSGQCHYLVYVEQCAGPAAGAGKAAACARQTLDRFTLAPARSAPCAASAGRRTPAWTSPPPARIATADGAADVPRARCSDCPEQPCHCETIGGNAAAHLARLLNTH